MSEYESVRKDLIRWIEVLEEYDFISKEELKQLLNIKRDLISKKNISERDRSEIQEKCQYLYEYMGKEINDIDTMITKMKQQQNVIKTVFKPEVSKYIRIITALKK